MMRTQAATVNFTCKVCGLEMCVYTRRHTPRHTHGRTHGRTHRRTHGHTHIHTRMHTHPHTGVESKMADGGLYMNLRPPIRTRARTYTCIFMHVGAESKMADGGLDMDLRPDEKGALDQSYGDSEGLGSSSGGMDDDYGQWQQ